MTRSLTFREVIAILLRQGSTILCFRCREPILYAEDAEREHFLEKALGGDDSAANARISHCGCHTQVTRGTGATTAGSSVGKAAKDKRIAKGKMEVNKPPTGTERPQRAHKRRLPTRVNAWPARGSRPMNKPRRA